MDNFIIKEIYGIGYERWIKIINSNTKLDFVAHFLEFEEYLEDGKKSLIRQNGDSINGMLKIDLITSFKLSDEKTTSSIQRIKASSAICTTAKVLEVVDEYSILCEINGLKKPIIAEFEEAVNVVVDTFIDFNGSLEIEFE